MHFLFSWLVGFNLGINSVAVALDMVPSNLGKKISKTFKIPKPCDLLKSDTLLNNVSMKWKLTVESMNYFIV